MGERKRKAKERRHAEEGRKVFFFGLPQYQGHVFAVDDDGSIVRAPMGVSGPAYKEAAEIHIKDAIDREVGYGYYVDDDGDVIGVRELWAEIESGLSASGSQTDQAELDRYTAAFQAETKRLDEQDSQLVGGSKPALVDYWHIIQQHLSDSGDGDPLVFIQSSLSAMPEKEIQQFDFWLRHIHAKANTRELWGAAFIIRGGCSDDGFSDFRAWLILQGKEVYLSGTTEPDSLAELDLESNQNHADIGIEELSMLAAKIYSQKAMKEMPIYEPDWPSETQGADWDEADLPNLYPRLARKYGLSRRE